MTSTNCSSTKDLWNKLSASVIKISSEEVDVELENARAKFEKGLLYFQSDSPKTTSGSDETSDGEVGNLVAKISGMLKVNKSTAKKIFENYLMYEFRGAGKSIEEYISEPELKKKLLEDIWLSHLREQLFLLHCMKLVWVYHQDYDHPYQENFKAFVESFDKNKLLENLIKQSEMLSQQTPPRKKDNESVTEQLIEQWITYNLWSQVLVAHILLQVTATQDVVPRDVLRLFQIYKIQNFGLNPNFQNTMTEIHKDFLKILSASQVSVLVHIIIQEASLDFEVLMEGRDDVESLRRSIEMLDNRDNNGLLMLAYNVGFLYQKEDSSKDVELIEKAMQVNQFSVLYYTLQTVQLMNDAPMEDRIFQIMINLLDKLLEQYYINVFCNYSLFYEVAALLLSNGVCSKRFWAGSFSSFKDLIKVASEYFPYVKPPLLHLVASFAKANSDSLKEILATVDKICIFAEEIPSEPIDIARRNGNELVLRSERVLLNGLLKIPAGTVGNTSQIVSPNPLVHWNTRYNFWDVVCAEQKSIIAQMRSGKTHDVGHAALVLDCIYSVLKAGWYGDKKMTSAIQEVFELVQCFCQMPKPPMDLLAVSIKIFTVLSQKHCENVCNSAASIKLIPYSRILPSNEPSLTSQVDYGIFEYVLMQFECENGKSQLVQSYIQFILEMIKHPDAPVGAIVAGIITVSECIFPNHLRWQYSNAADVDDVGLLCLKLFHKLLSPLTESTATRCWLKLCLESLLMSKSSPTLLEVATTGERYIEMVMLEQSTFLSGRVVTLLQKVQLSLSVLNLVLLKRHLLLDGLASCYLLEQLSTSHQIQKNNFYYRLTNYLHSRFHPYLPTLALSVIQKIFEILPISLRSYMGLGDNTIRQNFELRLLAEDDYPPLRTAIIDLIATCVRTGTQSALLELLFSNEDSPKKALKVKKGDERSKQKATERVPAILDFFLGVLREACEIPCKITNGVYLTVVGLVNTCWAKPNTFLSYRLKNSDEFWKLFCAPLHAEILNSPVYPLLFRVMSMELLKRLKEKRTSADEEKGNVVESEIDIEISLLMMDSCVKWNTFVVAPVREFSMDQISDKSQVLLETWATFLVVLLKYKKELVPRDVLVQLINEYFEILLKLLDIKVYSSNLVDISQMLLHLLSAGKSYKLQANFTGQISMLLQLLCSKYVYMDVDVRALLLAIVTKSLECKSFNIDEVCRENSPFIICLGDMILKEALQVPAFTIGNRGSPMLYCCVYQFLKQAHTSRRSSQQSMECFGATNTLASVMKNAAKLIREREDPKCAEVAMKVLVAASRIPSLVHYLVISELNDLWHALISCKENVNIRQEIEWDDVYCQGIVLSTNLVTECWTVCIHSVLNYVVDHKVHLLSTLQFLQRGHDRRALLLALQCSKLLAKVCDYKNTWQFIDYESMKDVTQALLTCVDLCILFLTRPKITLMRQSTMPFKTEEFQHPAEKNNLLLKITGLCLECLSKLTSPERTYVQQFCQMPDPRLQLQVIQDKLSPRPSLARDYQPSLSFGHLIALSQLCIQFLTTDKQREKSSVSKESPSPVVGEAHTGIAKSTLDRCLTFFFQQAKAQFQNNANTDTMMTFRKDIVNETLYLLNSVKQKLNKKKKRQDTADWITSAKVATSTYGSQHKVWKVPSTRPLFIPTQDSPETESLDTPASRMANKSPGSKESYIAPYTSPNNSISPS